MATETTLINSTISSVESQHTFLNLYQTQFYTDVQTLNHLNEAQLSQFLAIILGLISGKSVETDVDGFAAQHGANLKSLTSTVQTLLHIITEGMKRSLKEADVASDLKELGLDSAKAAAVGKLYSAELGAMSAAVASATFKVNQLVDMEWKFGVTAGTSELSELGACFLQLKLLLDKGTGRRESVLMEMTLPQFYAFLSAMQQAAAELGTSA